jgi:hypothetical protein
MDFQILVRKGTFDDWMMLFTGRPVIGYYPQTFQGLGRYTPISCRSSIGERDMEMGLKVSNGS